MAELLPDKTSVLQSTVTAPFSPRDRPNILVPAPFILILAMLGGPMLDNVVWFGLVAEVPHLLRIVVGITLVLIGARFSFQGLTALRSSGTHFEPWKPSVALATGGIFERTRNPMYQGLCIVVLGFAFLLRSDWTIVLLVLVAPIIHYGLVRREERYLERKFGDDFLRFTKQVPRYNWLFWPLARTKSLSKDWLVWAVVAASCVIAGYTAIWLTDELMAAMEEPGVRTAALARAAVTDRSSLDAAARAAWLRRSFKVIGDVEVISRIDEERAKIYGWAVEFGGNGSPLTILVFTDGVKVLETKTRGERPDITQLLKLSAISAKNVTIEDTLACRRGQKLYVAATTVTNRYRALNSVVCP